ncbi:MAG: response regulator [Kiloniellales bacterium]|nr:response regulator [Kiloniellales bacterium]
MERLRVLVVDDSQYMIGIVRTLLEAMGVSDIRGINCTDDPIHEIRTFKPDLIITDHIMEPINGLELIRAIRNQRNGNMRFVPVILLTGYAHEGVVTAARFDAGADAVLVKPVSAKRLHACIVSLYESTRTFVQTTTYFGPDRRTRDRPFEGPDRRGKAIVRNEDLVLENDDYEVVVPEPGPNVPARRETGAAGGDDHD